MAAKHEIYTCDQGIQLEVVKSACECTLSCCGKPMTLMTEKTADAKTEKHVPVITPIPGGYKVTVGSVPHPMVDDHWIEWIELTAGSKVYREYLSPGQAPEAVFLLEADSVTAREHCNKHGLWKA